ncbi:Pcs60p Ecym_3065 [Eremothecium cymbalariae DBVPG|uniref:Peroxisomal-coenzyme A synthetase n=1 Tax=Eremothecium cymbalariae (strain CBS 270.75 / DBVPG 7215 / KCTC 17166 / NRRL Y-17582) TaxID=931890 RepID=G8JR08_ERECY|nr:Hypothetical protein Ecym_3065 [Eremothecium cymbalariae DBVPG\
MSRFNDIIKLSNNTAIIVPETGLKVSYNDLADILGHVQMMFHDPQSPVFQSGKQSTIAISIPNGLEFVAAFLATSMQGNVAAPLNPNYKFQELEFYLSDLEVKVIFVAKGTTLNADSDLVRAASKFSCHLVELSYENARSRVEYEVFSPENRFQSSIYKSQERNAQFVNTECCFPGSAKADDVALVLHTSGTTSRPKIVPLLHSNVATSMKNIANTYKLSPSDVSYIVMPLFHVHGLIGALLSSFYAQGSVVIPPKFSARSFWPDYLKNGCTWFSCVPTISQTLLKVKKPSPMPKIRFIRSCSSALAPATFYQLEEEFGAPVIEAYAMTEAAHQMTSNELPPGMRKPGSVGKPQGVEVVILNDDDEVLPQGAQGEVSIRGPNVTPGYRNNDKANKENFTREAHYFRTGDRGYFDEDGFLILTGRLKELINRGGEKISPLELDAVILSHPAVEEVVSFGAANEKYGQVVNAAIVLKKGKSLQYGDLVKFMEEKVAAFKIPERVYFVTSLPKTPTGKIQRRIVAELFASRNKL